MSEYYIKKEKKLVKSFTERTNVIQNLLLEKFNGEKAKELISQMINEFVNLLPNIPYIGGQKNPTTQILVKCMSDLAVFLTLEKAGFKFEEIGEFHYKYVIRIQKGRANGLRQAGRDSSQYPFDLGYIDYQKKLTEHTQKKEYIDDWLMDFVQGDGNTFDWGWDIHECGVQKAYKRLGYEKYLPLICLGDFYEAEGLGFGFTRTKTLGFGAEKCTHRFVKKINPIKAWPPYDLEEFNPGFWSK